MCGVFMCVVHMSSVSNNKFLTCSHVVMQLENNCTIRETFTHTIHNSQWHEFNIGKNPVLLILNDTLATVLTYS